MNLYMDELFTCPNCAKIFQSKIAASYDTFGNYYSDLYNSSEHNPQPIIHLVNICPKCGFAAYTLDYRSFEIDLQLVQEAIVKVEQLLGKNSSEFNAGDAYLEIAEYCPNQSLERKAFTQLRACYAYRCLQDENLTTARKLTLETIKQVIFNQEFYNNPEELYYYLAGELNRELGREAEAIEYFKLVLEKSQKNSLIQKMTIHQISTPSEILPREFFKSERKKFSY